MSKKFKNFIVLEDDCIPRKEFFYFIKKCLKKYENKNDIDSICGYQLPELHKKNINITGKPKKGKKNVEDDGPTA